MTNVISGLCTIESPTRGYRTIYSVIQNILNEQPTAVRRALTSALTLKNTIDKSYEIYLYFMK